MRWRGCGRCPGQGQVRAARESKGLGGGGRGLLGGGGGPAAIRAPVGSRLNDTKVDPVFRRMTGTDADRGQRLTVGWALPRRI